MRLSALRDQLGYKLPELLEARVREQQRYGSHGPVREVLVGDDSESDAFVYSLYADVAAGRVSRSELERVLEAGETREQTARRCRAAVESLAPQALIDTILIHLDAQTPPSLFTRYGSRVIPFYNYWQAALVLFERGFLNAVSTLRIAVEFHVHHGFSHDAIARSYLDLARRGHATTAAPERLRPALAELAHELPTPLLAELEAAIAGMRYDPNQLVSRSIPPALDYVELAALHRGGRNRRRIGQRFG